MALISPLSAPRSDPSELYSCSSSHCLLLPSPWTSGLCSSLLVSFPALPCPPTPLCLASSSTPVYLRLLPWFVNWISPLQFAPRSSLPFRSEPKPLRRPPYKSPVIHHATA